MEFQRLSVGLNYHCFKHPKLSIGCPILDECFRGGLLLPGVNEVSGESGSGKTQIALQLCLTAQLSEENGGLNGGKGNISISCSEQINSQESLKTAI